MEIRLKNLTKVFPGEPKKNIPDTIAVNNFDIVIPDGKLVGLLGPSGCGKSTTLYMIAGLLEPTSGEIWFGDQEVTRLSPEKRGIGLVFQNYALYPHMTIYKNVAFPLTNLRVEEPKIYTKDIPEKLDKDGKVISPAHRTGELVFDEKGHQVMAKRRLTKDEIDKAVREAAKLVQIENQLQKKPNQLSGGQQQRVAIARALVKKPRVLLLDEPLSNLDARLRLQTREEIRRLQRNTGITTIFVTHDQEEAMSISDEIVVMKLGLEQQRAHPQDVYNDPANKFVANFLGTPPINLFEGAVKDGKIYIGEEEIKVLPAGSKVHDQKVTVGIRPEGFVVDPKGQFSVKVDQLLTMGRDITLVCDHPLALNDTKIIIDALTKVELGDVKLSVKPEKCFIFAKEGEERRLA